MTISTTIIKNSYSGNGSTSVFNYTFKISLESEMEVIIRSSNGTETVKTLTTHYTVGGVGNAGGGTVTFTAGNIPVTGETVILRRDTAQTQTMDLIDNDPMSAETIEDAHDKSIALIQELQEEIDRSIKLSRTNTMTSTEFTVDAATRANKILAFDSAGEISVTQELGTYKGTDATTTTAAYVQRDIIKSTTAAQLNNVYICVADSVAGDLLTDTDHFQLLVDAVAAGTSATAAAASASAAATSETNAATSESNSATSETNAARSETNAATSETNAASSATAAATSATNAATSETNASTSETNAASSATSAASSATSANSSEASALTYRNEASTFATASSQSATSSATSASNASTSENNAQTYASNSLTYSNNASTSATNAATSETNAANSATSASNSATTVENIFDNFDDRFLGTKASDPTLDNDGNALSVGAVYYNSTANEVRFYNGSTWDAPSASAATSATNAANSASAAATSETNAATSASTASTQATNSANSATAAQTAQTAAETALDTFDDRFLGAKSSDPTLDNDGNALIDGALYWNTSDDVFKVYDLGNTQWNRTIPTASDQTKINTVSDDLSGSNTIGTVATNITNVNDVASNITGVNSFAERYRVVSSDPATSLDAGDIIFNTTGNVLKYYDGSAWFGITAGGITDLVQDSTPQLGGNLDLNGNDITGTGGIPTANLTGTIAEANLPASALGSIWESKNSSFTAEARKNYFVDTSSAALTATLPSSPTIGDEIRFLDVTATFDTNNLTIARNGNPIQGDASDLTIDTERAGFSLVFYNSTQGWLLTEK
ncbi:hypothetical protein OAS70_01000 [Candidatus Pelagibacter sp.]|nr:hypothetical protein [Candidatus Pelagibacter sp.]